MRNATRTFEEIQTHGDKYCSDADIKKWILATKNDQIVGIIAVFQRTITFQNTDVLLGGIGKVRVAVNQRKQGIASKMMKAAMQELDTQKAEVAYLCTNLDSFLAEWYGNYGFVPLAKPYTYLGLSGKKYTETDGMIAPITSQKIYEMILTSSEILNLGTGNW